MHARISESRGVWLVSGLLMGLGVAYFWPHEPIRADQADRSDKFGMISVPATLPVAGLPTTEVIFILDFLTGALQGFYLNPQAGAFTQTYYRDVGTDFSLGEKSAGQPMFAFVGGQGQLTGHGAQWGASLIYVAEVNSGALCGYAFPFAQTNVPIPPQQMIPVAKAQFKKPTPN